MTRDARARLIASALRRAAGELERDPFLLSGLAGGGWIEELEDRFGSWLGAEHVLATSSATGALVTALRALGLARGGEVIVPSYGWVGCVGAIQLVGANPVFADIREDTFQMDPESVLEAIGPRTAAILAPHLCGYPCAIDDLAAIARAHGLPLIEDCAQALGAQVAGQPVGRWGDFAVFSFGPGKLVDAGEGGMLVARTEHLRERALLVAQHPLRQTIEVRDASLRAQVGGVETLNFRIHPLGAFLANVQLQRIAERLAALAWVHEQVRSRLARIDTLRASILPVHHRPNGTMIPLRFVPAARGQAKEELLRSSACEGVEIVEGPIGTPCHLRPDVKAGRVVSLPVTERRCAGEELLARIDPEAFPGIAPIQIATRDRGLDLTSEPQGTRPTPSALESSGTERARTESRRARVGSPGRGGATWRS